MKIYVIRDWRTHYETAKSMQINRKSQAEVPVDQDMRYLRMMALGTWEGPAVYGCFISMVCWVSSRGRQIRNGYLTDSGEKGGHPLSVDDLGVILRMSPEVVSKTLDFCTSISDPLIMVYESATLTDTCEVPESVNSNTSKVPDKYARDTPQVPYVVQDRTGQEGISSESHHPAGDGEPDPADLGSDEDDLTPSGVNSRKKNTGGKWTKSKLDAAKYEEFPGFCRWWKAYPRADGKRGAFEAWLKRGLEDQTPSQLAALAKKRKCRQWQEDEGKFIPHGSTYLNARMDEDEAETAATGAGGIGGRFTHG